MPLLAAIASSIAAHAFVSFVPCFGQGAEGMRGKQATNSPASDFVYVSAALPGSMRAPTSIRKQDSPRHINTGQRIEPDRDNAKVPGTAEGHAPLQVDGDTFFPSNQLSRPAQPAVPVTLPTVDLEVLAQPGRSVLTVWIDARGNVVEATIESSDAPELFARLAVEAFRKTPFIPGERNGRPVGTVMRIEVSYDDLVDLPI